VPPPKPDAIITAAEDALVLQTKGKIIDGFPGRSGYGTKGQKIILRTNYFALTTDYEDKRAEKPLHRYEIQIRQEISKQKRRRLLHHVMGQDPAFAGKKWATDYGQPCMLVTTEKLDLEMFMEGKQWKSFVLPKESEGNAQPQPQSAPLDENAPDFVKQGRDRNTFDVSIQYQTSFNLSHIIDYLKSPSAGATYSAQSEIIQLLNVILTSAPNRADNVQNAGQNKFYPIGDHPGKESYGLTGGLEAVRGYYSSVRPSVNRLLVNLNVTSGAFVKNIPLFRLMTEFGGTVEQKELFLRMLKVDALYIKDTATDRKPFMKKTKTIVGFARPTKAIKVKRFGNANEVTFSYVNRSSSPDATPVAVTVAQYFKRQHGITLKEPQLPVLNVGTLADPQYLPIELCTVLPGQAYRRLLSGDQTSEMLKFAARFPNLNAMSIAGNSSTHGNGLRLLRLAGPGDPQLESVNPWGFRVGTDMITVPGRVLDSPTVSYAKQNIRPKGGSWNCADQKFVMPGTYLRWQAVVVNAGNRRALNTDPEGLVRDLDAFLKTYGLNMGERGGTEQMLLENLTVPHRAANDTKIKLAFSKAEANRVNLLLIILPENDKWLYSRIKYYGDVVHGINTICSVGSKIQKQQGQGMYFGNLALKFNLKGGGISHTVSNTILPPLDKNTMLVGIDVTHPSPGSAEGAPSIACVVASVDHQMFQWPGSIRTQTGREEMVSGLEAMVLERLDLWVKRNKQLPTKIVIYRDGVSEGQYQRVLEEELPLVEKAFEKKYGKKEKWPKIAIIIVGKRHHTRFYPTCKEDADYNPSRDKGSWNPKAGTVVDRAITHKILREFYLQAHQGLQGTARPAHYVVIKDDISFNADVLEQFTHHLCYLFNRATKAVSICPPAYYADLLCTRGRAYLHTTLGENNAIDAAAYSDSGSEWTGGVHPRIRDTTWYV
jgi:hypothetical protein